MDSHVQNNVSVAKQLKMYKSIIESLQTRLSGLLNQNIRLKETKVLLESIFNNIDAFVWVIDVTAAGQFKCVHMNPACSRLTGKNIPPDQNKDLGEVFLPPQGTIIHKWCIELMKVKRPVQFQYEYRLNGLPFWMLTTLIPIFSASGDVYRVISIGFDITKQKLTEKALIENEQRYELAGRAGRVGVWDWDLHSGSMYLDPWLKEMLGYKEDEITNNIENWSANVHPEDKPQLEEIINNILEGKKDNFEFVHRMLKKDGSVVWLLARGQVVLGEDGKPVRIFGTDADITERMKVLRQLQKTNIAIEERVEQRTEQLERTTRRLQSEVEERSKIEKILRENEQRYRSQFEDSLAVKLIIDPQNGNIHDANPSACDFYGYSHEKLKSMNIADLNIFSPERVKKEMQKAKKHKRNHFNFQHKLADGRVRDVEVYSSPIRYQDKQMLYSIIHDVTDRNRAVEKARLHQEQLAQVSRLITVGELAQSLAHELNQPLCAILSHSERTLSMVKQNPQETYKIMQKLGTIVKQADRAGKILNRIKSFIRKEPAVKENIDINSLVKEALSFLEVETRHNNIKVKFILEKDLPPVPADRVQVEQVVINLARNAIDAMAETDKDERQITLKTAHEGRFIKVSVIDTGPGVHGKYRNIVFEPFYTTKNAGLGLGLSISSSILESHGGILSLSSEKNTCFEFTLPVHASK